MKRRGFSRKLKRSEGFVWSSQFGATIITVFMFLVIPVTLFLVYKEQDVRQRASSGTQTATISVDPPSGTYNVGQKFAVSVFVNGGNEDFTAARTTVAVSDNLTVESLSLTPVSAGGCNFTFADPYQTPTTDNPSFYGLLPEITSNICSVYTLTLRANAPGTGLITLSEGSVTSAGDSKEILLNTQSGSYLISPQ